MRVWGTDGMILAAETELLRKKSCKSVTFSTKKSHVDWPGIKQINTTSGSIKSG
jgi:hypothetical protein